MKISNNEPVEFDSSINMTQDENETHPERSRKDSGTEENYSLKVFGDKTDSQEKNELTDLEAAKYFSILAAPSVASRFIGAFSDFLGAYMLSRIDETHLAASGVITATSGLVLMGSLVSLYTTSILQKRIVASDPKRVGNILNVSYLCAAGISLIDSVFLATAIKPIYTGLGLSEDVVSLTQEYFTSLAITGGILTTATSISSQQTCYAIDEQNFVLLTNIPRRALYLFFAYGLIYGNLGMPKCDVSGLAYAKTISSALDQLVCMAYFFFKKREKYGFFNFNINKIIEDLPGFIKTGSALGFQSANEYFLSVFIIVAIGRVSNAELASAEVAMQYNNLLLIPVLTAAQACAIQVGKYKNNLSEVLTIMRSAMAVSMLVPLITIPIFAIFPNQLAKPFEKNLDLFTDTNSSGQTDETSDLVRWLLLIVACNQVPGVVRQVFSGALRGIGDFNSPMVINFLSMSGVGVASSYLLGEVFDLGSIGFFLGTSIGLTVSASVLFGQSIRKLYGDKTNEERTQNRSSIISRAWSYMPSCKNLFFCCKKDLPTEKLEIQEAINEEKIKGYGGF